ncbi:MAG: hypothetical protein MMC33_009116 [Icmadophila ericetorum]|nr:hypothetical protein [Icmadophila ericetorum]
MQVIQQKQGGKIVQPRPSDLENRRPPLFSPGTYASADYVDAPSSSIGRTQIGVEEILQGVPHAQTSSTDDECAENERLQLQDKGGPAEGKQVQEELAEEQSGNLTSTSSLLTTRIRATLSTYWFIILQPFVPSGIALNCMHQKSTLAFAINSVAIFPISALAGSAFEDLTLRIGALWGNFTYMTFRHETDLRNLMFYR